MCWSTSARTLLSSKRAASTLRPCLPRWATSRHAPRNLQMLQPWHRSWLSRSRRLGGWWSIRRLLKEILPLCDLEFEDPGKGHRSKRVFVSGPLFQPPYHAAFPSKERGRRSQQISRLYLSGSHHSTCITSDLASRALTSQAKPQRESVRIASISRRSILKCTATFRIAGQHR